MMAVGDGATVEGERRLFLYLGGGNGISSMH